MLSLSKRIEDILLSLLVIILTFPLQLFISGILLLLFGANPIFKQRRGITFEHDLFYLYKFRTMDSGYPNNPAAERDKIFYSSPGKKLRRFTKWLRVSGLDELPQFYNVLAGSMSVVGPRPLMLDDLLKLKEKFPAAYNARTQLKSKPGITGLWQISGRKKVMIENLKRYDLYYEKRKSVLLDIKILFSTIKISVSAGNTSKLNLY